MIVTRRTRSGQAGFTLLEMLVAVAILGLVLVALTSGVRFAGHAWTMQQRRSARQGDTDAVQNVLRQMLQSARAIKGSGAVLTFTGKMPAALARGGLFDITLDGTGGSLVLSWHAHARAAPREPGDAVLLKDIADFGLSYYAPPHGWQSLFKDRTRPPALIKITLRSGGGGSWPPLVVAPMVDDAPPTQRDHRSVTEGR